MEETSVMNIYQKIQAVSNEIRSTEKDMVVKVSQTINYKAVSDLSVVLAVKDAEKKYKLTSIPVKQELIKTEVVLVPNKSPIFVDIIKMTTRIINIENPQETIDIESFGRGYDTGDKGFGKASTYARKYALLNAYKIATGEDPDKDPSPTENNQTKQPAKSSIKREDFNSPKLMEWIYLNESNSQKNNHRFSMYALIDTYYNNTDAEKAEISNNYTQYKINNSK